MVVLQPFLNAACNNSPMPHVKKTMQTVMPRRAVKTEFISDKTKRNNTYKKRRAGIMKKVAEMEIMTGADLCVVCMYENTLSIYGDVETMHARYLKFDGTYDFYSTNSLTRLVNGNVAEAPLSLHKSPENTYSLFGDSGLLNFD